MDVKKQKQLFAYLKGQTALPQKYIQILFW